MNQRTLRMLGRCLHGLGLALALAACSDPASPPPTRTPGASPGTPNGPPAPDPAPPSVEARALWVNRFEWGPSLGPTDGPAQIVQILDRAKAANFNVVYFQVRGEGDAYYRSTLEPCSFRLCGTLGNGQPSWDPLEVAVREAHARGIQLHAWLNAFTGFSSPSSGTAGYCARLAPSAAGSPDHMLLAHPEWQLVTESGAVLTCATSAAYEYVWVSPGIPAARTHLARVAADVARRYAVDGIHLDRIRYPGPSLSYDEPSLAAFGRRPAAGDAAWAQWRRDAVSLAVREVHDSVRAARASVVLSAAVWGIHEDRWGWRSSQGYAQYFQDPRAWAAGGYLDVAVPMTYYDVHATPCGFADWACLLDDHVQAYRTAGRHVYVGISPAIPAGKTTAEVLRQIDLARARGAAGVALYSYGALTARGLWTVLAEGPFRTAATVPRMPWR